MNGSSGVQNTLNKVTLISLLLGKIDYNIIFDFFERIYVVDWKRYYLAGIRYNV